MMRASRLDVGVGWRPQGLGKLRLCGGCLCSVVVCLYGCCRSRYKRQCAVNQLEVRWWPRNGVIGFSGVADNARMAVCYCVIRAEVAQACPSKGGSGFFLLFSVMVAASWCSCFVVATGVSVLKAFSGVCLVGLSEACQSCCAPYVCLCWI